MEDYLAYLRGVAAEEDWESLPSHLQDAIDRMLIDEVRSAKEETVDSHINPQKQRRSRMGLLSLP